MMLTAITFWTAEKMERRVRPPARFVSANKVFRLLNPLDLLPILSKNLLEWIGGQLDRVGKVEVWIRLVS
jgi:hypothetical protein